MQVERLARDFPLPSYQTEHAAGVDLHAAVDGSIMLQPGQRSAVPTGIVIALPPGYEAQTRPRSGLALKHGISIVNTPGTIDADYRGEIKIILVNHGSEAFTVNRGDRIAQLVFKRVEHAELVEADKLDDTARGKGGFGSTGK